MLEPIFIAKPTPRVLRVYPAYAALFPRLYAALAEFHPVVPLDLPDIWVRDFLPVQHCQTGELVQPFFNPRYANYTPRFTERIRQAVRRIFPVPPCTAVIDGGNISWGPERTVFCLKYPGALSDETALADALGARRVVWLPPEEGDKIGHIDGVMQFIGRTLLVSDERFDPYLKKLLSRRLDAVRKACPDIAVRFLPCVPDGYDKSGLSAKGVYVNFLETSRAVFVPQFSLPQDRKVFAIIKAVTDKPVIGIECAAVSRYGGAVHCLTQTYWRAYDVI